MHVCIRTLRPPHPADVSATAAHGKHMEDIIIESSKFPAAQPPDPNQPSKIETEYWPCPPSLAAIGRPAHFHILNKRTCTPHIHSDNLQSDAGGGVYWNSPVMPLRGRGC